MLSVVLFLAKISAWYLTHSVSVLTDALESTVNIIAGFIGLYSIMLAARPSDDNHPYGHGKIEFVSAGIEGALITAAGLFIIYEAVMNLIHPEPLKSLDWGILIVGITGIVNFIIGKRAKVVAKKERSATLDAAGSHLITDAWSTAGIVVGMVIVFITKWLWLDSVIALVFAFIIIRAGYKVMRKSLAGIMDEADLGLLKEVVSFLQENRKDQWIDLHNLRVIQYGEVMHLDAHLTLPWYYEVRQAEKEIHELEDLISGHFGGKVEMFVHVDACETYSCKLCCVKNCAVRQEKFSGQIPWTVENAAKDSKHGK